MALKSDSSQYFLGYLWWVLEPLLYVCVFYVVFNLILNSGRDDFLIFLMCGKLPFVWFSKSVTQASGSIVANAGLIGSLNIPKTMFPLAIIQEGIYKQTTVFALLAVVLLAFGYQPTLNWLWLVPVMLCNYLLIVLCGFIGAILVCFYKDFMLLISLGMIFLMFTSGVFWDVHALGNPAMTDLILSVNPIAFLLDSYRQVLMLGLAPDVLRLTAYAALFLVLLVAVSFFMNRKSQWLALKALTA